MSKARQAAGVHQLREDHAISDEVLDCPGLSRYGGSRGERGNSQVLLGRGACCREVVAHAVRLRALGPLCQRLVRRGYLL